MASMTQWQEAELDLAQLEDFSLWALTTSVDSNVRIINSDLYNTLHALILEPMNSRQEIYPTKAYTSLLLDCCIFFVLEKSCKVGKILQIIKGISTSIHLSHVSLVCGVFSNGGRRGFTFNTWEATSDLRACFLGSSICASRKYYTSCQGRDSGKQSYLDATLWTMTKNTLRCKKWYPHAGGNQQLCDWHWS